MRMAGCILERMLLRPYWVMNNSYRKRILPMWMAGYILGRMQYAPIGLRLTSTEKEYYPCGQRGTYWGVCNTPLPGYDQFLSIKNTTHADSRVHSGAYAFMPLSGYDQLLLIKNTTHADGRIYAGAYAIRPYWVMNNFC